MPNKRLEADAPYYGALPTVIDSESLRLEWAREGMERLAQHKHDGRVGFIGMIGHTVSVAPRASESGRVDVVMFPLNLYQNHEDSERAALLDFCTDHVVGIVAMKPYYGGRLVRTRDQGTGLPPEECLQYAFSKKVQCAVPGPGDSAELEETLVCIRSSVPEGKTYRPLQVKLRERLRGPASQRTKCGMCVGRCPLDVGILGAIHRAQKIFEGGLHQQ